MKTFTIATTITAVASLIQAAPLAHIARSLSYTIERRVDTTNILLCSNADFQGHCTTLTAATNGECYNFLNTFNNVVSSIRTGGASTVCSFFINDDCTGRVFLAAGAHAEIPGNDNDKFSSVRCP